jgi:hypothetical protein
LYKKNLALGGGLLVLLTMVSITASIQNLGWAASINCPAFWCVGTDGDDVITGSNNADAINGRNAMIK